MPPRRTSDPYLDIYRQTAWKGDSIRPGFLEHREISEMYEYDLDLDEREKREFWADYNHYMVSDRSTHLRKDLQNPFWQKWGISPDAFDWDAWRNAMGDSPRRK